MTLPLSYVLPLKWDDDRDLADLTTYLGRLADTVSEVIVVDGSPAARFAVHARAWAAAVRHLRPDPRLHFANGKVDGVTTGVLAARHEAVVIADDDVRWDAAGLARASALLATADLVRPQNVFRPLPWHARWDTGRSLLNRAVAADFPGTFALRRSTFVAVGGYDGDVMFENLELIRTLRVHGGRERNAPDLYVVRRPPTARHFARQRVRQAYDDLAQPWRLVGWLLVLPLIGSATAARRPGWIGLGAAGVVGLAEIGRRRAGGRAAYPPDLALWAVPWLLERSVCAWVAVACRVTGGVPYAGRRLRVAAHSRHTLRRRAAAVTQLPAAGRPEPREHVRAVAERLAP